jgi:hypothetical protein
MPRQSPLGGGVGVARLRRPVNKPKAGLLNSVRGEPPYIRYGRLAMTTQEWQRISRTLDFILQQKQENPAIAGIRGEAEKPKKKKKSAGDKDVTHNVEQLRMF